MDDQSLYSVIGIFSNRDKAEAAVDQLWHAGFRKEQIGLAAPGEDLHRATTPTEGVEEKAADGAVVGAVSGSAVGAVAGALIAATVPGIGPVLAGGLLAGLISGAAAGAALGTFAGPFVAMGFSEMQAKRYATALRTGRTVVIARVPDRADKALMILESNGPEHAEIIARPELAHMP